MTDVVPPALSASAIEALNERAHQLIPGGAHTYAKGDDQYPVSAPPFIARGQGCHAWDLTGREFIEYGMGLRAVTLGHAFEPVVQAAMRSLPLGSNFTRPSLLELECAEQLQSIIPYTDMVKFCKDGSMAVDGAIRLARAYTGRDLVAMCGDHPFFSTNDWFIGHTDMNAGIPQATQQHVLKFTYNHLDSLRALFDAHPGKIACVILEAARTEEPAPGYLEQLKALTHREGAVLIFDEMITGFRWHNAGAQGLYGVHADLSAFGKAMANGFSVSALAGRRELMELGGARHGRDRVFLLSTTHGAETHALAAALATMRFYQEHPVVETLHARGARLRQGFESAAARHGVQEQLFLVSRDCNLLFATRDPQGQPSQEFRTLFMQELVRHGVLAPSFVVSYSHSEADIDHTIAAIDAACAVYRKALSGDVNQFLEGRPVKPAVRKRG
jgi:glutamate-1-semialdehyde 2,1-aminomutase